MTYDDESSIVFATLDHRAHHGRVFGIRPVDLARHTLVLGRTGSGKSVLLERLLVGQIERGHGLALLDPHGDLAESVLARIPRRRINDVVLFDPAERAYPVGLNPLELTPGVEPALITAGVLSAFRRLFAANWGIRTEHVLRNVLLAVLASPDATLLTCLRMLADEAFRRRIVERVSDPVVRLYWTHEFPGYSASFRAEVIAPVLNKLSALLTDPSLRAVVGQIRSSFSIDDVMNEGRVLIANLAKGRVGDGASTTFGALLTVLFQLAAYRRVDLLPEQRRPFTLYADEFQTYATHAFAELLAEGRKFGFAAVLASQGVGAMDEGFRRTLLGNVGTLATFRLGAEDAHALGAEFAPMLTAHDLANLGRHQVAIRMSIGGVTSEPFTAVTLPPAPALEDHGAVIRRVSRERYGSPRTKVERQVRAALGADTVR